MKLDKVKKSFNDYDLELSWGQLEAIRSALENNHSEPISDELLAELDWYMERVPGPGEEEEDAKQNQQDVLAAPGAEGEGEPGVELPPSEGPADVGKGPLPPPEEMPGTEGGALPEEGAEEPIEEPGGPPPPKPPTGGTEADEHLPAPPPE